MIALAGVYHPGSSALHRCPAGIKLFVLCVVGTTAMIVGSLPVLGAGIVLLAVGYAIARIEPRAIWRLSRALLVVVAIIAVIQALVSGLTAALVLAARLLLLVGAANLLTLTTPTSALIDVIERVLGPLRRFGVDPGQVGIAVALTLRFIPVIATQAARIREAQAARGVRSYRSFLLPLVISTVRMADGVGEALTVRGFQAGGARHG
ncbi:MAG: energy-coupling factor transporter transmembrane protein EcfT [Propionibacteriaceae bacterium]|jgi:biotin transport system permease protein|nr:energy-coupling factor transporter transmembrane protein EcfT [Propionibacteriaceae bacterium]